MKLLKSMTQLRKLWRRKKKKKQSMLYEPLYPPLLPPPPPSRPPPPPPLPPLPTGAMPCQCHFCRANSSAVEPSAPPLPTWLENDHQRLRETGSDHSWFDSSCYSSPDETHHSQEIMIAAETGQPSPTVDFGASVLARRKDRNAGIFECVLSIGSCIIRCVPCFNISERSDNDNQGRDRIILGL